MIHATGIESHGRPSEGLRLSTTAARDPRVRSCMPKFFTGLLPRIPIAALLRLSEAMGGERVRVPLQPLASSRLATVLSQEEFAALCGEYRGCMIVIPRAHALRVWLRDQSVVEARAAGMSVSKAAHHFQMTERNITRITTKHRASGRHPAERRGGA